MPTCASCGASTSLTALDCPSCGQPATRGVPRNGGVSLAKPSRSSVQSPAAGAGSASTPPTGYAPPGQMDALLAAGASPQSQRASSAARGIVATLVTIAAVAIIGGGLWAMRPSGATGAGSSSTPTSFVTVTATATETATRTATATATTTAVATVPAGSSATAAGGEPREPGWPAYTYAGPGGFDVCRVASFPLPGVVVATSAPPAGSDVYWTVESAQAALRALNYGKSGAVVVDGLFGPQSATALASFQRRHDLPATGELDEPSWAALNTAVHYWQGTCP